MPSKVRYVITNETKNPIVLTGGGAIHQLLNLIGNNSISANYPPNWSEMRKVERVKYLTQFLPPTWVLYIFRERRNNRRNRSLYCSRLGFKPNGNRKLNNAKNPVFAIDVGAAEAVEAQFFRDPEVEPAPPRPIGQIIRDDIDAVIARRNNHPGPAPIIWRREER